MRWIPLPAGLLVAVAIPVLIHRGEAVSLIALFGMWTGSLLATVVWLRHRRALGVDSTVADIGVWMLCGGLLLIAPLLIFVAFLAIVAMLGAALYGSFILSTAWGSGRRRSATPGILLIVTVAMTVVVGMAAGIRDDAGFLATAIAFSAGLGIATTSILLADEHGPNHTRRCVT